MAPGTVLDKLGTGSTRSASGLLADAACHPQAVVVLFSNLQPLCVSYPGTVGTDNHQRVELLFLPATATLKALGVFDRVVGQESAGEASASETVAGPDVVACLLGTLCSKGSVSEFSRASAVETTTAAEAAASPEPDQSCRPTPETVAAALLSDDASLNRPLLAVEIGHQPSLENPNDAILAHLSALLRDAGLAVADAVQRGRGRDLASATGGQKATRSGAIASSGAEPRVAASTKASAEAHAASLAAERGAAAAPAGASAAAGEPPLAGYLVAGGRASFSDPRKLMGIDPSDVAAAQRALHDVEAGRAGAIEALRAVLPFRGTGSADEVALPPTSASVLAQARGLLTWHLRSVRCGVCGSPTSTYSGGMKRRCTNAACGARVYPRTDCVVIAAVIHRPAEGSADGEERVLVGRQSVWPAGMHSCLSGFIDPGETLEAAVRREIAEETGLGVGAVSVRSSQPWPVQRGTFGQVMVGAVALSEERRSEGLPGVPLVGAGREVSDAAWLTRSEAALALLEGVAHGLHSPRQSRAAGGPGAPPGDGARGEGGAGEGPARLFLPGPYAIAHHLVRGWVEKAPTHDRARL